MCDPVTISVAAVAMTVSAVTAGYAAYAQNKSANAAAEYNSRILKRNADIADMQANATMKQAAIEEKQYRQRLSSMKSTQRSVLAASGVVVDQGSALDIIQDTTKYGEIDALTLNHNAAVTAWGQRNEAVGYRAGASMASASKTNAAIAGGLSFLSSASSSVASYAMMGASAKTGTTTGTTTSTPKT